MIELLAGLVLGLGGSLHCAGMCGPIAIALPSSQSPKGGWIGWRQAGQKMAYQFGRVTTYTLLGAVVGLGGSWIALTGYSRTLSIVSGVAMITALAVQLLWKRELIAGRHIRRAIEPVKRGLSVLLSSHGTLTHFGIGLLNGLLPCGLVTAPLLGSLGTGSVTIGALFMLGFGFGTVPLMSAIAIGGSRLSCQVRQRLRYAAPTISIVIATLFILRGMALGIPHISPSRIAADAANCPATTSRTSDCCK
jgi:sulfite exporter TauE/SafE